jgi:hypothetical protein
LLTVVRASAGQKMAGAVGIPVGGAYMMGNYMENGQ